MYPDKSIKDDALLQAICRTNRLCPGKAFCRIVDYFRVIDDTAKSPEFDKESILQVISNLSELRSRLPKAMQDALAHFSGVDRSVKGLARLEAAQNTIGSASL